MDLLEGKIFPSEDRLSAVLDLAEDVVSVHTNLARDWLRLLG